MKIETLLNKAIENSKKQRQTVALLFMLVIAV